MAGGSCSVLSFERASYEERRWVVVLGGSWRRTGGCRFAPRSASLRVGRTIRKARATVAATARCGGPSPSASLRGQDDGEKQVTAKANAKCGGHSPKTGCAFLVVVGKQVRKVAGLRKDFVQEGR